MHEYDGVRFQPPAPLALVVVRDASGAREQCEVPLLIDSGADVTLLPQSAVLALALEPLERRYELVGFNGQGGLVQAVVATIVFSGKTDRGQFLVTDQEIGVLGRNILNTVTLTLDGPRQSWR